MEGTPIPRDPDAIMAQMRHVEATHVDIYGVERETLLRALPWRDAKEYFDDGHAVDGVTLNAATWPSFQLKTEEEVRAKMRDFLPYAWAQANARKGPSSQRCMSAYRAHLYLLGSDYDELRGQVLREEAERTVKVEGEDVPDLRVRYVYFGKPALVVLSEMLSFDWRAQDDDEWYEDLDTKDPVSAEQALSELE